MAISSNTPWLPKLDFSKVCASVITNEAFIKGDGSKASKSTAPADTVCLSDVTKDGRVDWDDLNQPAKWMPKLTPRQLQERAKYQEQQRQQKIMDDFYDGMLYDQALENLGMK